jgi:hypothetical protein
MEIIIILATWYATKVYYTKNLKLSMTTSDPNMAHATCAKCAQTIYTHIDNLRVPFYCLACK